MAVTISAAARSERSLCHVMTRPILISIGLVHRPTGDSELKLDSGELVVGSRRYRTHGSLRIPATHRPSSEQRA